MSAKKATKVYRISMSNAKTAEQADQTIREMLELIDGRDGAEDLACVVWQAAMLCDRAAAAAGLAESGNWHLAVAGIDTVAGDAEDLREAALEGEESDYALAQALKAEALVLGAGRAVAAKRGTVAACLLADACEAAAEIVAHHALEVLEAAWRRRAL